MHSISQRLHRHARNAHSKPLADFLPDWPTMTDQVGHELVTNLHAPLACDCSICKSSFVYKSV